MRAPVIDLLLPLSPLFHPPPPSAAVTHATRCHYWGEKILKYQGFVVVVFPDWPDYLFLTPEAGLLSSEFALSLRFASSVSYLTIVVHLSISLSTFMHIYLSVYVYMCIRMCAGALARACE